MRPPLHRGGLTVSYMMLHGLGDCTPADHCGCDPNWAPRDRVILTGATPRKVVVLHKVIGVDAYHVRTTTGARLTVPGTQLLPRQTR